MWSYLLFGRKYLHGKILVVICADVRAPELNNLPYAPAEVPHFSHHAPSCLTFHQRFATCPLVGAGMHNRYGCLAERRVSDAQLKAAERPVAKDERGDLDAAEGDEEEVEEEIEEDTGEDDGNGSGADDAALVLRGVTLVVPHYPYTQNIYHFLNVVTFLSDVAHNLPTVLAHYGVDKLRPPDALSRYPLNVLLLNPPKRFAWQSTLLSAILSMRVPRASPLSHVNVVYAQQIEQPRICVRNPVLLGRRGHINVWPFPNASAVVEDATAVPVSAVRFREDVYAALKLAGVARNPVIKRTLDAPASGEDAAARLSLPPRVLGYARRAGRAAFVSGNVHAAGTVRRFGPDDEAWFTGMLREETASAGFKLRDLTPSGDETLEAQAGRFAALGVLVGIHGANLVNAVFMRPLSGMV